MIGKKNIETFDSSNNLFFNGYLSNAHFYSHIISNSFEKKWTYADNKKKVVYVYHDPVSDIEMITKYDINQVVEYEKDDNGFIKTNKHGSKIIHSKIRVKQGLHSFLISKEQFISILNKQLRKEKINKLIG